MKSAEEYIAEWQQKVIELFSIDAGVEWCDEERTKFWKQALQDSIASARDAALVEAADALEGCGGMSMYQIKNRILALRTQKP